MASNCKKVLLAYVALSFLNGFEQVLRVPPAAKTIHIAQRTVDNWQ
jgi:hypothetical protein